MERQDKVKLLEDLMTGRTSIEKLKKETTLFILPANDGTDRVHVISAYSSKTYTKDQFNKLEISKGWL